MELAADTRLIAQYSPTSTPILDVLRPVPHESRAKLSAGEYFFLCSAVILVLIGLQDILRVLEALGSKLPDLALIGLLVPRVAGDRTARVPGSLSPAPAGEHGD